jgi:hypothetical protein
MRRHDLWRKSIENYGGVCYSERVEPISETLVLEKSSLGRLSGHIRLINIRLNRIQKILE